MVILGVDPGSRRIGYGIIESGGGEVRCVDAGVLFIKSRPEPDALAETKTGIARILSRFQPAIVAVEKLYLMRNRTSGVAVAEHRGVILLAAHERNLSVREYSPNEIKAGITGYGLADKRAVAKMVKKELHDVPERLIDDATDALAIALFALYNEKTRTTVNSKD